MSLWWNRRTRTARTARTAEKPGGERSAGLPGVPLSQLLAKLKTQSFAEVDLSAMESSLQAVAVHTATDLIASLVSELPVDVFRGRGPERQELTMPGWLQDPDGSGYGLQDWCYRALMCWLLRGNVYGEELDRSAAGVLRQVELFHPDHVSGSVTRSGAIQWLVNGREVPEARFVHRRVNPVPGVVQGLSPVGLHAWTIGLSLTSTRFGLQWFQDGGHPNAILQNSEVDLDDRQIRSVKDRFLAALRGSREPLVFGKGWSYHQLQLAPEESQFLQTQEYSQAECARIFGPGIAEILGYASGGSMTYANVVDRDISLLKYSVGKWIRRLERFLGQFLPRPQYVRFNRDALLETNTLQRYQAYQSRLANQWGTVNEVRRLENLRPVPWGDRPNTVAGAAPADDDEPSGNGGGGE